ncbi:coiled-coil domain-containing protein 83 [Hypomesus transpacificus]|uniref:coiled-coil domain-containing protein 83 n=1 Tax=Hypomesus transpacificus TaxID=137520 RepID=UPI001F07C219|nr:coiled-coil domain-containing protein 83 [Hypomesus transpacificus]XP_046899351.1 coiled-coil domain-containing protein 83 [Hypomesus transpacificus]
MGKKSSDEDKITLAEAYTNFQIELKTKEIQEFQEEIIQLETEKRRLTELREQLKEEQTGHIRLLRKQAKEQETKLKQREAVNKEQVEQALQQNLEMVRNQEGELAELHSELKRVEEKVQVLLGERQVWLEYKNVGSQEHLQQIRHLEAEHAHVQRGFQNMADNIKRSLEVTFNEIDKKTVELIEEKQHLATEKAIKHLDKNSRQEVRESAWLQKELAIYKREVSITEEAVQSLEAENLEHMSQLFDQRLHDLQISRNIFLTQAAGLGVYDSTDTGMTDYSSPTIGPEVRGRGRRLEEEEPEDSCDAAAPQPADDPPRDLGVLLYGSQTHLQEEARHLGPLELKLLSVVGQAMPLHPLPSEEPSSSGSYAPGLPLAPEEWPLTAKIIHNRFK